MADIFIALNDGTSHILLNNGTDAWLWDSTQEPASFTVSTGQVSRRTLLYQAKAEPVPVIVLNVDRWWRNFDRPVLRLVRPQPEIPPFVFVEEAEEVTVDKWFIPLSDPKRLNLFNTALHQALAYIGADPFPEAVTIDRWLLRLSEPVRVKPRATDFPAFTHGAPPLVAGPESWWRPLSEPIVKVKPRATEFLATTYGATPIVNTTDQWWQPFSEPVRVKPRAPDFPAFFYDYFVAAQEVVTVDKWFVALSEPVRQKIGLNAALHQYLAYIGADPFPEAVTIDRWLQPLSKHPGRKPEVIWQQSLAYSPTEIVDSSKWFSPLSEPIKKSKARASDFPAFTYGASPIIPSSVSWWQNLSTPPKSKPRAAEYLFAAIPLGFTPPETVTVDKWFTHLSEPKIKSALRAAEYPAFTYGAVPIPPVLGLFTAQDTRVTFVHLRQYQSIALVLQEVVTADKWFAHLSQPYLRKVYGAQHQQFAWWSTFTPPEPIFADKWFSHLSQPYLIRRFDASQQKYLAFSQIDFSTPVANTPFNKGYIIC